MRASPGPFRIKRVQGNILFDIIITGYHTNYEEYTLFETCKNFINLITSSQTYIYLLEDTAKRNNCSISIAGVEDFIPQIIYKRHDLYDSDVYIHKSHAKNPLYIKMNITNFILFRRKIREFYTPDELKLRLKPKRSIMPTPDELLEFLNEGEITY